MTNEQKAISTQLDKAVAAHFQAQYGDSYVATEYALVIRGVDLSAESEQAGDRHYLYVRPGGQDRDITENMLRRWLRAYKNK